jgi:hypothetical protein
VLEETTAAGVVARMVERYLIGATSARSGIPREQRWLEKGQLEQESAQCAHDSASGSLPAGR